MYYCYYYTMTQIFSSVKNLASSLVKVKEKISQVLKPMYVNPKFGAVCNVLDKQGSSTYDKKQLFILME